MVNPILGQALGLVCHVIYLLSCLPQARFPPFNRKTNAPGRKADRNAFKTKKPIQKAIAFDLYT